MERRKAGPGKAARRATPRGTDDRRARILDAAFAALMTRGYADATTLEIATRARVSKRELYALFDSKRAILAALIARRTERMGQPLELPTPGDRRALAATLVAFGAAMLSELCHPGTIALYRLAIGEGDRAPALARTLERAGRLKLRAALTGLLAGAQAAGLLGPGDPEAMAGQFFALLFGDLLLVRLLLRVAEPPSVADTRRRARAATDALLALHDGRTRGAR